MKSVFIYVNSTALFLFYTSTQRRNHIPSVRSFPRNRLFDGVLDRLQSRFVVVTTVVSTHKYTGRVYYNFSEPSFATNKNTFKNNRPRESVELLKSSNTRVQTLFLKEKKNRNGETLGSDMQCLLRD